MSCFVVIQTSHFIFTLFHNTAIPSVISDLTYTSLNYQSVRLTWNTPSDTGECNIEYYIITVTPSDGSNPWTITTTDNSTSYTVTELMFGQSYNFSVSSQNCIELGEDSNVVTATLPGEGILL